MASLMPQGKQVYSDNAGAPLAGGLLYTYAAGTTTPLATYSDQAGAVPNANPVVLDARGEATVFWAPNAYKAELRSAADVAIWTQDDIYPAATLADIAGLAPLASPAFTGVPTGLGPATITSTGSTIARSLADRFANSHDEQDFSTLANAITAANSSGKDLVIRRSVTISTAAGTLTAPIRFEGGGKLVLNTGGSVTLSGPLSAPLSRIFDTSGGGTLTFSAKVPHVVPQWWGATGDGTTDDAAAVNNTVAALPSGGTIFFPSGTYCLTAPVNLRSNIRYTGGPEAVLKAIASNTNILGESIPPALGGGLYYSAQNVEVDHLEIDGNRAALAFPTDDQYGNAIRLNLVQKSRFHDLYVHDSIFNGISVYNESNENDFRDIRIVNAGKAGTPPGAWTMNGIFFEAGSSGNRVDSVTIDTTLQYGIWIGARDLSNNDNVISRTRVTLTTADGIRIGDDVDGVLAGPVVSRVTLDNVTVLACGDFGIRAFHGGTGWVDGLRILGGVVQNCASGGVLFDTRTRDCVLIGTSIKGNGTYGLTAAGQDLWMSPGRLSGHTIDWRDLGTRIHALSDINPADGQQGSFTPTVLTGGAAVGRTYASQQGSYRVNGNRVEFELAIVLSAKGSSTGNLTIGGLPFTSLVAGAFGAISVHVANVTFGAIPWGLVLNSATAITLFTMASGSSSTPMNDTQLADTSEFYITGSYGI